MVLHAVPLAVLTLALAQATKPPTASEQKQLVEANFAADWTKPEGLAERRRILAELGCSSCILILVSR
jgi:hypothetical protein